MPGLLASLEKLEGLGLELKVKTHQLLWGAPEHVAYIGNQKINHLYTGENSSAWIFCKRSIRRFCEIIAGDHHQDNRGFGALAAVRL
jgi:hypothetical protein